MLRNTRVLLTGVTGFLGSHITIQLLERGYEVVGTLRNMGRAPAIERVIAQHTSHTDRLRFAEADLLDEAVWPTLMEGVDYVLHIASPFPRVLPKDDAALVEPAKTGTLSVLRAASQNGVTRVVLTSSVGAVAYGRDKGERSGVYEERDWTDVTNRQDTTPYYRSKTMAEQAAWDFIAGDSSGMTLSTICPGAILGPVLEKDFGTSANIVIKLMDGSAPALPRIGYDLVDVRSVADLHICAMEREEAAGERWIATTESLSFKRIADILRARYPERKIPRLVMPNVVFRLFSLIDPTLKPLLLDLGVERRSDNSKARRLLDWEPIPAEEAVLACAESVVRLGIV